MVRYYRNPYARKAAPRRRKRVAKRKFTYTKGKTAYRGGRFRMRMKSKGSKWQQFVFYDNIRTALELDTALEGSIIMGTANPSILAITGAAVNVTPHNADARLAWYGDQYAIGAGGAVDGFNNPTGMGNGLLAEVAKRDPMMGITRWDYSGFDVTPALIRQKWNAVNNGGGLVAIPATQVFFKGIKVNVLGRHMDRPGLMYLGTKKSNQHPYKLREQVGKLRAYIPCVREKVQQPTLMFWSMKPTTVGGPVGSRVRVTCYYKIKMNTIN